VFNLTEKLKNMMNFKYILPLVIFLASLNSCSSQNNSKKDDCMKCSKTLDPLSKASLEVSKDDIFYYEGFMHASVGEDVEYEIENTEIVSFHHEEVRYKNEKDMKEGMSGADAASKTLAFQAKWKGETTITIKEMFRGDVKNSHKFKIVVQ